VAVAGDEDSLIFRPRILLKIMRPERATGEGLAEADDQQDMGFDMQGDFGDDGNNEEEENTLSDAGDLEVHVPYSFDLAREMEMINCSEHLPFLQKKGFVDEGSFAHLTWDDMSTKGVKWIPKRAGTRILELAGTVRRAIEKKDKEKALHHPALALAHSRKKGPGGRDGGAPERAKPGTAKTNTDPVLKQKIDAIQDLAQRLVHLTRLRVCIVYWLVCEFVSPSPHTDVPFPSVFSSLYGLPLQPSRVRSASDQDEAQPARAQAAAQYGRVGRDSLDRRRAMPCLVLLHQAPPGAAQ
jgi:hypothetical protein